MIDLPLTGAGRGSSPPAEARLAIETNWPLVLVGGALALLGLRKILSARGLMLTAIGSGLLYRGLGCDRSSSIGSRSESPDPSVDYDPIDEASWESFPASDSPSFSPGKA